LDGEYRWAVVGHPSRDYLWFLARTPQVPEADWTAMTASASAAGFDLSRLLRVPQD
jgi:apolipoprotein D and lipocalin family protein